MKTAAGIRKVTVELYVHYVGRCLNDFRARFAAKFFAVPTVHPLRYLDVIVSTLVVMLQFKVQYYQSYHTALGDSYLPIAFRLMHVRHRIIRRYDIALGGRQRSTASWNVGKKKEKRKFSFESRQESGRKDVKDDRSILAYCRAVPSYAKSGITLPRTAHEFQVQLICLAYDLRGDIGSAELAD